MSRALDLSCIQCGADLGICVTETKEGAFNHTKMTVLCDKCENVKSSNYDKCYFIDATISYNGDKVYLKKLVNQNEIFINGMSLKKVVKQLFIDEINNSNDKSYKRIIKKDFTFILNSISMVDVPSDWNPY